MQEATMTTIKLITQLLGLCLAVALFGVAVGAFAEAVDWAVELYLSEFVYE